MAEVNIKVNADIKQLMDNLKKAGIGFVELQQDAKKAEDTIDKETEQANAELKKQVSLVDKTGKEFDQLAAKSKKTGDTIKTNAQGANDMFAKLGTTIAAAFSIQVVGRFAVEAVKAFAAAEAAGRKLYFALGQNGTAYKSLTAQAEKLQNTTPFEDDQIIAAQAFLAAQGRTEKQIKKTIEAAAGLATVTGTDLQTAVEKLDATNEGMTKGLSKLDSRIKKLTTEELANGKAVDLIAEKYKGFAEDALNTTQGKIEQLSNQFGNLEENIGRTLSRLFETSGINAGLTAINEKASELNSEFENIADAQTKVAQIQIQQVLPYLMKASTIEGETFRERAKNAILEELAAKQKVNNQVNYARLLDIEIAKLKERNQFGRDFFMAVATPEKKELEKMSEEWKRYAAEVKSANESMMQRIKQLQIENTDDEYKRIRMQLTLDIEAIDKTVANEELKAQLVNELNEKANKQIEKLMNERVEKHREFLAKEVEDNKAANEAKLKADMDAIRKGADETGKALEEMAERLKKQQEEMPSEMEFNIAQLLNVEVDKLPEIANAFKTMGESVLGSIQSIIGSIEQLNAQRVDFFNQEIDRNLQMIQIEQADREAGYANNVDALKAQNAVLAAERQKALKQQQQAARAQVALDTVLQTQSLVTSSAQIFKALSPLGPVGVGLAIGTIATMFGAFLFAKTKAIQAAGTPKFEKGGYEMLGGKRHVSGGTSLGVLGEGELGEGVGIFSRSAVGKYGAMLPSMVDMINKGKFPVLNTDALSGIGKPVVIVNNDNGVGNKTNALLERYLAERMYQDGEYTVIKKGSLTIRRKR